MIFPFSFINYVLQVLFHCFDCPVWLCAACPYVLLGLPSATACVLHVHYILLGLPFLVVQYCLCAASLYLLFARKV